LKKKQVNLENKEDKTKELQISAESAEEAEQWSQALERVIKELGMPKYVGGPLIEATQGQDKVPELIVNAIKALRPCMLNYYYSLINHFC